jgi:hypothetical protein
MKKYRVFAEIINSTVIPQIRYYIQMKNFGIWWSISDGIEDRYYAFSLYNELNSVYNLNHNINGT